MSEYFVAEGALKLKGDSNKKKKKKKSKHSRKAEDETEVATSSYSREQHSDDDDREQRAKPSLVKIEMTKAERAFKKMQEKKRLERIMEKASKSHRQRVEEFNSKLDNLSEHYDIPKVSWTK